METLANGELRRRCADCQKTITKAHRVYLEAPYCTTCYYREFKHRACKGCKDIVRLPRFDKNALCPKCEREKPCVRCHATDYKLGKFTKYGPACNSCSVYFRKIENCEACGAKSQQLSRTKNLPHNLRVCPRCVRSIHATCQRCKRHRILKETKLGEKICNTCFEKGEIDCPVCGELMPAGRGNKCEDCYWSNLLSKRTEFIVEILSSGDIRNHFQAFSHWLHKRLGSNIAAIKIDRFFQFFLELDRRWKKIPEYVALLNYFGPEGLRRYRLALTWMVDSHLITLDEALKKHHSELGQITRQISKVPEDTLCGKDIHAYLDALYVKRQARNTSLRSLRLSLSSAMDMTLNYHKNLDQVIGQESISRYLIEKNGQTANLTPFVNFLNDRNQSTLSVKVDESKVLDYRRKSLELVIVQMLTETTRDSQYTKKWIVTNLQYYHGVSRLKALSMFKTFTENSRQDMYCVAWKGADYWIPRPISALPDTDA